MNIACIYVLHIYYNIIYIFSLLQARYYIQNPNCCITTKTPRSDYTRRRLEVQMEVAMAQLELAKELELPVILQATGRGKQGLFKLPKIGGNQTIQVYGKVKPCICLVSSRCQLLIRICEGSDPDVSEGCTEMMESPVSLEVPPQDDAERLGSYQGKALGWKSRSRDVKEMRTWKLRHDLDWSATENFVSFIMFFQII